jgi:hypothetical protein
MNETEESPNMDKAQETVVFYTPSLRYMLHLKAERKMFRGEVPEVIPAKLVEFKEGRYSTDNEDEIRLIRATGAYKRNRIREYKPENLKVPQQTIRGAISSKTISKEAGVEEKPQVTALREMGISECPESGCDYVVRNDLSGNKMRMHHLGKHRISMRPKSKKDLSLAEAKKGLKELKVEK